MKNMGKKCKTFVRWIGNILLALLVMLAIVSVVVFFNSKRTKDPIPTVGNIKFLSVLSNSMSPTFKVYDLIIDKKVPTEQLKKGDAITFKDGESIVTHRIVDIQNKDNKILFKTKGDANNVEDENLVPAENVVAKYFFRIPYMGLVITKIKGPVGIAIVWIIFMYIVIKEVWSELKKNKLKATEDKSIDKPEAIEDVQQDKEVKMLSQESDSINENI